MNESLILLDEFDCDLNIFIDIADISMLDLFLFFFFELAI